MIFSIHRLPCRTGIRRARCARAGERSRTARREVPEIRLSGAWLERIGFPAGRNYLISVEREFRTIILQRFIREGLAQATLMHRVRSASGCVSRRIRPQISDRQQSAALVSTAPRRSRAVPHC